MGAGAGALTGGSAGFLTGTAMGSFQQEAGESREQFLKLRVDGKPLPIDAVNDGAVVAGAISAGIETVSYTHLTLPTTSLV